MNEKFKNYIDLENYLIFPSVDRVLVSRNVFFSVEFIPSLNVDIVTFNTAVFSSGGNKFFEKDEKKLLIPEYAIFEAASKIKDGAFHIFVTHHPLNWLTEESCRLMQNVISRNADIHLYGHMHDPQAFNKTSLRGKLIESQAGAIFSSRTQYYNGYSLITIEREKKHVETMIRFYYKERNEFDKGVDILENGVWWSSAEAQRYFSKVTHPIDVVNFANELSGNVFSQFIEMESKKGGDKELHDKFVAPPLVVTFIQNDASGDTGNIDVELKFLFDEMVKNQKNFILYAKPEYGRTTLLHEIRYRLMNEANSLSFPRLPSIIDFNEIKYSIDNTLKAIRPIAKLMPTGFDFESLLKLGHCCIMIDDVIFDDIARMKILREFVARFPKCQYIFSSPHFSATKMGACVNPEMPVRFEFVEIRELKRGDMRQLLQKEERCNDVEMWLDRIQDEFKEINLPFTAANGTILIEILSDKHNFTAVNRSVLIEQFVDSTLSKAAV